MHRVNKNNNKRCTGISDENHCAPSKTIDVWSRQTALLKGQTTPIDYLANLKSHPFNTIIVQVYAPTPSSSEEALETYWTKPQRQISFL